MSPDPLLPDNGNFPRARSPDDAGNERKRRRKVLSCYDCRKRKLQCDRAQPACSRCTKAGQASSCLYLEDAADAPLRGSDGHPTPTSINSKQNPSYGHKSRSIGLSAPQGDLLSRLEFQDGRIKQLEAALAQASGGVKNPRMPPTPESIAAGENTIAPVQDRETTLLRGRSFKTQYHGNTHPGALIARIPELHGFTRETFEQFPALSRIKDDMGALERRTSYAGSQYGAVDDSYIKALLPSKEEADRLVQLYLDNYGAMYHVIHLPSFWEEYNKVWPDIGSASAHFVALLLVMIAAAQCLTSAQPWLYVANSSVAREKGVMFITAVENWLVSQSQKHVGALDFQIRVLLFLAKLTTARKFKRTWTEAGNLLRFCIAGGLHRTPDIIRKPTSLLDKELRKRVWAAVVELELQASFDRGMVSSSWPLQSDCPPPNHLSDDDLDPTTDHITALPRADFHNSSYLCLSSETIMLRHGLNNYLNSIRQTVSFNDSKRYSEEIDAHLQALPQWIGASSEIPLAHLSISLRQYQVVLHDRQYRAAETKLERDVSQMLLYDTAVKMIETHRSLTSKGILALEILCNDQLRAAMSLCVIATAKPWADSALSTAIVDTSGSWVKDAIDMVSDKVIRFGREQRQLWVLVAAYGHMKSKQDPSNRLVYMQEAVDRITRPYYKIMACQEDAPTQVSNTPARQDKDLTGVLAYLPPGLPHERRVDMPLHDPTLLDMDEIAAWTFEDWSFNPADLNNAFPEDSYPTASPY